MSAFCAYPRYPRRQRTPPDATPVNQVEAGAGDQWRRGQPRKRNRSYFFHVPLVCVLRTGSGVLIVGQGNSSSFLFSLHWNLAWWKEATTAFGGNDDGQEDGSSFFLVALVCVTLRFFCLPPSILVWTP